MQRMRKQNEIKVPMIPIRYVRDRHGNLADMQVRPFEPGMTIRRNGKTYVLDAKGTQHRVD